MIKSNLVSTVPRIKNGSRITIGKEQGKIEIMTDHRFTWLQKRMIKWLLGFDVYDYSESEGNQDGS